MTASSFPAGDGAPFSTSSRRTARKTPFHEFEQREKTQRHQITAWGAQAEFAQQRLDKGTRVEIIGRIDQQSWGAGEHRQYKTILIANEIMLVRSAPDASVVALPPAPAADNTAQPAADAATPSAPKRRRMKAAA